MLGRGDSSCTSPNFACTSFPTSAEASMSNSSTASMVDGHGPPHTVSEYFEECAFELPGARMRSHTPILFAAGFTTFVTVVPVRNLIVTHLASWRRSVRTSGPAVNTTGRLESGRARRGLCEDVTLSLLERGPALWRDPRTSAARPRPAAIRRRAGSGDEALRPREWRGSSRVRAAGRLGGRGCCSPTLDAGASGCSRRRRNAGAGEGEPQ